MHPIYYSYYKNLLHQRGSNDRNYIDEREEEREADGNEDEGNIILDSDSY